MRSSNAMKTTHQIWLEGHSLMDCEGGLQPHRLLGEAVGESFRDACNNWNVLHPDTSWDSEKDGPSPYSITERGGTLNYWGIRVFPTEHEAVDAHRR